MKPTFVHNDLDDQRHNYTVNRPSRSTGVGFQHQELQDQRETQAQTKSGADKIIDSLSTYNVHGRTFSDFVGTTAKVVLGGNQRRVSFTVQNNSGTNIYIGIGTPPSNNGSIVLNGIQIYPGGVYSYESNYCPVNDIFILGLAEDQHVVVNELSK